MKRHKTLEVKVGNILIGNNNPIVVQSMTNTDTADVGSTVKQIIQLHEAGSEIVRITVNNQESAAAVPKIREKLLRSKYNIPLAGCFHYNGHKLLKDNPGCAEALDKYRINPGNVGFGKKRNSQFEEFIELAIQYDKPIRIGVNWGSLDQALASKLMDENSKKKNPKSSNEIMHEALITSALNSAKKAEDIGISKNKIIVSCKTSNVRDLVKIYESLSQQCNYPLHLGLTEAGMGIKGIAASASALAILLNKGIGDTIRVSITPEPGAPRTEEAKVCQEILQALELRHFKPQITACPGCGRTTSSYFQKLAKEIEDFLQKQMPVWKTNHPGVENLKIAVMGCIVNGPGESKHADIGISLPGTGESPVAPVFIDGEKTHTLRGDNISKDFIEIISKYIERRF